MSPTALLDMAGAVTPANTPRRRGSAFATSLFLHLGLALLVAFWIGLRSVPAATPSSVATPVVYVADSGPGGGGGGSPAPASSKEIEIPRHQAPAPIPVEPAPPAETAPPQPVLDAPIVTNAAGILSAAGRSIGLPGLGGGGPGSGVGPGAGPGVGPGTGGNTGGGARQVGNGVTSPTVVRQTRPNYTSEAMRAKIQGNVELEIVVRADGTVGEIRVTKSLDPGLDQEAIKCAKQWLFRPGRFQGSPVDVFVSLVVEFRLH